MLNKNLFTFKIILQFIPQHTKTIHGGTHRNKIQNRVDDSCLFQSVYFRKVAGVTYRNFYRSMGKCYFSTTIIKQLNNMNQSRMQNQSRIKQHVNNKMKEHVGDGSRTIFPKENCPLTLKLTLTQTQTIILTGGQFFSGAIVRTP